MEVTLYPIKNKKPMLCEECRINNAVFQVKLQDDNRYEMVYLCQTCIDNLSEDDMVCSPW